MTRKLSILIGLAFSLFALATTLQADLITLKDGRVINGRLYRDANQYIVAPMKGAPFKVAVNEVVGITLQSTANPAKQAREKWQYVKMQIKRGKQLPEIIRILQAYIKKHTAASEVKLAREYLARYQKYQKAGLINFGGHWIAPAARQKLLARCARQTAAAQQLLLAGKLSQANAHVLAVLRAYPQNIDALILKGIIQYHRNDIQASGESFAAAVAADPRNIVALNDQAITFFRQRRQPAALVSYQKALHIDTGNRLLLDNIAAALQVYKKSRRTPLYQHLKASFTLADQRMERRMARHGLYRFGSGWVDARTQKILEARLAHYQKKKTALNSQYQVTLVALESVNAQIASVNRQINALVNAINILQASQGSTITQTGLIDLGNQAVLDSDVAALSQAQALQMQLMTKRISIMAGIKTLKIQAAALEKHAPRLAIKPIQQMMLPQNLSVVPLPSLLPATAISTTPPAPVHRQH